MSRAEAARLMDREEAQTVRRRGGRGGVKYPVLQAAVQETADHRLKERLEETLFWTEEVRGGWWSGWEVVGWRMVELSRESMQKMV